MTQHNRKPLDARSSEPDARPSPFGVGATLPQEFAHAANLMMVPLVSMAAMSALGFTIARHGFGIWAGAMSGAIAASQRMAPKSAGETTPTGAAQTNIPDNAEIGAPATRAVVTSIADARAAAKRVVRGKVSTNAASRETVTEPAAVNIEFAPGAKPVLAKPANVARPEFEDNLKLISGIGPKLEQVLNGLGVWTFAQIASWTPAETAWVDDHLGFAGRIGRDDWAGQALALGNGKAWA